jgi:MFS transporter, FHS family, L-fucose permease
MLTSTPETPEVTASERACGALFPSGNFLPFFLVTALFFLWGIPNNLNDVLIRHFMKSFAITRFQAGLIQSAFYMGYFLLAMPAALLMRKLGYKAGFITGLVLFGTGSFLFWPAAVAGRYSFFLFALFVIASGLSFLETASNPFIAQCGDPETSERRLNFSQAFNPIGAISGVLLGTIFIFSGVEFNPHHPGPKGAWLREFRVGTSREPPIFQSLAAAYLVPLAAYLFIAYYALLGSKVHVTE